MLARTKERLRLLRLVTKTGGWHDFFWSEMHGAPMKRWHLDEAVRQVGGMLITVSRGIFDALPRSESPQLRLRSARTGEQARVIKEKCALSEARIHWVNSSKMLGDSLTKLGYPARAVDGIFFCSRNDGDALLIPPSSLANVGKRDVAPLFNIEDMDDINPITDPVPFDTLVQDASYSEDTHKFMRVKYE